MQVGLPQVHLEVNSNDFLTVKIQNDDGKKETLYWLQYFDGFELLENGGNQLLMKSVILEYEKLEYYSPKIEDYTKVKVIRSLTID